jgi:hypothetical protein
MAEYGGSAFSIADFDETSAPNGRALSRTALQSERAVKLKPTAKIAMILSTRSGVGYSAVLGRDW